MKKTVGDIIKVLEKYPKDMKFTVLCSDMGGYTEHFEIVEMDLELNADEYSYYQGEHRYHNEHSIEEYNPKLTKVIALDLLSDNK